MQILDVMRKVNTENEVKFLLAAYVETLPFYDFAHSLPHGVTDLPLAGMEDVRDRFETLLDIELSGGAAQAGERVHAIVREAAEVFGVALTRLRTLRTNMHVPTARDTELSF
jgi:hypothetical protein